MQQGSLEDLLMRGRQDIPAFLQGGDTRTFQQYDNNNATAQRQLAPAWQAIQGMTPDVVGTAAAFMGSKPDQQAVLQRVGQAMTDPMTAGSIGRVTKKAGRLESIPSNNLKVDMTHLRIADENLAKGRPSVTPDAPIEVQRNVDTGEYELRDGYHRYLANRGGSIASALEQSRNGIFPEIKAAVTDVKPYVTRDGFILYDKVDGLLSE